MARYTFGGRTLLLLIDNLLLGGELVYIVEAVPTGEVALLMFGIGAVAFFACTLFVLGFDSLCRAVRNDIGDIVRAFFL
jgi:hypothetical protein